MLGVLFLQWKVWARISFDTWVNAYYKKAKEFVKGTNKTKVSKKTKRTKRVKRVKRTKRKIIGGGHFIVEFKKSSDALVDVINFSEDVLKFMQEKMPEVSQLLSKMDMKNASDSDMKKFMKLKEYPTKLQQKVTKIQNKSLNGFKNIFAKFNENQVYYVKSIMDGRGDFGKAINDLENHKQLLLQGMNVIQETTPNKFNKDYLQKLQAKFESILKNTDERIEYIKKEQEQLNKEIEQQQNKLDKVTSIIAKPLVKKEDTYEEMYQEIQQIERELQSLGSFKEKE